jgi:hypothetical protein
MKHKNINLGCLLILVLAFFACKEQDIEYRQYVTENGRVYPGKAEGATASSGVGQVYISWPNTTRSVTEARIYWNNRLDSVRVNISAQTDTVRQTVDVPEGTYSFTIRTFDKNGNVSVPVEVIGRSYGDTYRSTLRNRTVSEITKEGADANISWLAAGEDLVFTEVRYTDVNGEVKTIRVLPEESSVVCTSPKATAILFEHRSLYLPPNLIDTFYMEWEQVEIVKLTDAKGYWEFDDATDPTRGIIGNPLVFVEDNKTITSIAGPRADNKAIRIPRDSKNAGVTGTFVKCLHGITPKTGQTKINEYTVMWDIRLPDEEGMPESSYYSLMSARTLTNSQDQDFAIKRALCFGIGSLGYTPDGTLTKGRWQRIVLSAKASEYFRYFVDGTRVYDGNAAHADAAMDGRFSLLPEGVLFFSDEDGDDSTIDAAAVAIWNVALSDFDVAALGSVPQ